MLAAHTQLSRLGRLMRAKIAPEVPAYRVNAVSASASITEPAIGLHDVGTLDRLCWMKSSPRCPVYLYFT